ncbi:MAG TPA: sigma-70 family RNA polymerase sigma factor [Pyrinomonadaceae bacterium]|nr:sigma-70 family RNA polymerase sigma factor [Pyrinomonadaceae bacterium]
MTDEDELIRRAQAGDVEAFCRLAKNYQRRLYTLAMHYCRDPHDAEDLSQEVWLKAFKSLQGFRAESSFYTWLRQITINSFLNHRRAMTTTRDKERTAIRFDSLDGLEAESQHLALSAQGEAEDGLVRKIMVERVMGALGELTPPQRLIFLLKHREGMTYQEIASACECSTGAVKKSLFRSLLKLRAALGLGVAADEGAPLSAAERG